MNTSVHKECERLVSQLFERISALLLIRTEDHTGVLAQEEIERCAILNANRRFREVCTKIGVVAHADNQCALETARIVFAPRNSITWYAATALVLPLRGSIMGGGFSDAMAEIALAALVDISERCEEGAVLAAVTQMGMQPGSCPKLACAIYSALGYANAAKRLATRGVRHGQCVLISPDVCELIG